MSNMIKWCAALCIALKAPEKSATQPKLRLFRPKHSRACCKPADVSWLPGRYKVSAFNPGHAFARTHNALSEIPTTPLNDKLFNNGCLPIAPINRSPPSTNSRGGPALSEISKARNSPCCLSLSPVPSPNPRRFPANMCISVSSVIWEEVPARVHTTANSWSRRFAKTDIPSLVRSSFPSREMLCRCGATSTERFKFLSFSERSKHNRNSIKLGGKYCKKSPVTVPTRS